MYIFFLPGSRADFFFKKKFHIRFYLLSKVFVKTILITKNKALVNREEGQFCARRINNCKSKTLQVKCVGKKIFISPIS